MSSESHWSAKRPIPFTNVSGETIPAFAVMAITALAYENGIAFLECERPGTTFVREYAVNNAFDVPADRRGTCFRAGDVRVLYDSGTPVAGEGWGPKPGQWSLSRGFPGFALEGIVHSGHRIAKALFVPLTQVLVKTTLAVSANSNTTGYRVYAGTFGSETDGGFTTVPTARNRTGQSMAADEWAWLHWTNNGWELRCQQNRVYHVTYLPATPVAPGSSGAIVLPDGRVTTAINWSADTTIQHNDKCLAWQDFANAAWYLVKSGGSGADRVWHATAAADIDHEATGNVTHPDTSTVSATNWSDRVDIKNGEKVILWQDPTDSQYYCLRSGFGIYHALLDEDLDRSDADVDVFGPTHLIDGSDPGTSVVDNPYGLYGKNGDKCLFVESPISANGYTLVQVVQRQPRWFKGALASSPALASTDSTVSVNTIAALDGGPIPGSVTANNVWGLSAAGASACLIVENLGEDPVEYELVQVKHVVKTIVTSVDWDDPDLTKTTQEITVMHEADPDDPETIFAAADVNVVIDVDVSGTTLRKTRQQVRVLDSDTADSPETIDSGTTCP